MKFTQSLKTTATEVKPCDFYDYTMLDGYAWAEVQAKRGYRANPAFGEWPYNIIANGRNAENETYVIKEYTEHDVKTWIYSNSDEGREEYTNHLNQLHADACEGLDGSVDGYGKVTV